MEHLRSYRRLGLAHKSQPFPKWVDRIAPTHWEDRLIEVTSHRGFTISVCPQGQSSVATIARETGQPILIDGEAHQTIVLNPVASHESAMHDAIVMIDRILRGWHRKTRA